MATISVRGIDENTHKILKEQAERSGRSINALILECVHKGLGVDPGKRPRHHDLDHLAGTWSVQDQEEFAAATALFEEIDEQLWK